MITMIAWSSAGINRGPRVPSTRAEAVHTDIWLVITMLNIVYCSCILIAYTIPSAANPFRKHFGRIAGLGFMLLTTFVGTHRENIGEFYLPRPRRRRETSSSSRRASRNPPAGAHVHVDDDECSQYYVGFIEYFSKHGSHTHSDGKGYTLAAVSSVPEEPASTRVEGSHPTGSPKPSTSSRFSR